jgi:hypothetical protein
MLRRTLILALAAAPTLHAQSIMDTGARLAPQYNSYEFKSPSNTKISEFALPLFVLVPITSAFSIDVGTAFAQSRVDQTNLSGVTTRSTVSGLTDTQVRANYTIGNDFVVLTAGVNLPTGQSTVTSREQLAAGLIGSDFLAFPISNMGSGLGGTGGIAFARPIGQWNVGIGASMRKAAEYEPFDAAGGPALHYRPGDEYRIRGGLDRAFGTGRMSLGVTYSTFGDDNLAGSIYNTGNRWLSQGAINNTFGPGELTLAGWDLFRARGTLADGSTLAQENIANASLAYGINVGSAIIEPNVEGRSWAQAGGIPTSMMATVGLRSQATVGGFSVLPSVGYSFGKIASQRAGANTTADLTGLHAMLAIRLR